ncbi:hypothetical protein ACFVAJ_18055 [Agromyces sp. NPDC057679]|uniref:hypothetical protein n=1 Tax=Agromyces sp. NPDC057679 TaxID=3346207 RepID=UPI003671DB16
MKKQTGRAVFVIVATTLSLVLLLSIVWSWTTPKDEEDIVDLTFSAGNLIHGTGSITVETTLDQEPLWVEDTDAKTDMFRRFESADGWCWAEVATWPLQGEALALIGDDEKSTEAWLKNWVRAEPQVDRRIKFNDQTSPRHVETMTVESDHSYLTIRAVPRAAVGASIYVQCNGDGELSDALIENVRLRTVISQR